MKYRKPKNKKTYSLMDELMASATESIPADYRRHQLTRMYEGLHAFETAPEPSIDDWTVLADAVNLTETLVLQMKICEDTSGLLMDGSKALALAGSRHRKGQSFRLDGEGINAIRAILNDYAQLIEVLPARTMIRCHRLTEDRLHAILAGKKQPHDIEM